MLILNSNHNNIYNYNNDNKLCHDVMLWDPSTIACLASTLNLLGSEAALPPWALVTLLVYTQTLHPWRVTSPVQLLIYMFLALLAVLSSHPVRRIDASYLQSCCWGDHALCLLGSQAVVLCRCLLESWYLAGQAGAIRSCNFSRCTISSQHSLLTSSTWLIRKSSCFAELCQTPC